MKELRFLPDDVMADVIMAQTPKKLLEQHEVGAVVISCMDFRFRKQLSDAIFQTFGIEDYDEIKIAGGAKNIASPDKPGRFETALDDILLAVKKHGARKVVLLTHQNCGKYAEAKYVFTDPEIERVFHERELRLAGDILFSRLMDAESDAEILLGYAFVDKDNAVLIDHIKPSAPG